MELHDYTEESLGKEKLIRKVLFLSVFILILEIIFGVISNSLALLTDALHVFTDIFSAFIALLAVRISRKGCDDRFTLGYHRFEVMASFANGLLLMAAVGIIFFEAFRRIMEGAVIDAYYLLPAAVIGLIGNLYVVKLLHAEHKHDINVKGVYLHAFSDTLASVAVILGGVIIILTGQTLVDSLISMFIGIFIGYNAIKLIRESSILLLHGVPPDVDVNEVRDFLLSFPEIENVHSVNAYALCSNVRAIDAHIVVGDMKLSEVNEIRQKLVKELKNRFKLTATSLQFEHT
ncbi:MAG: cation diffusion facilitator family transporter [Archaeoglobaceae archaeon]